MLAFLLRDKNLDLDKFSLGQFRLVQYGLILHHDSFTHPPLHPYHLYSGFIHKYPTHPSLSSILRFHPYISYSSNLIIYTQVSSIYILLNHPWHLYSGFIHISYSSILIIYTQVSSIYILLIHPYHLYSGFIHKYPTHPTLSSILKFHPYIYILPIHPYHLYSSIIHIYPTHPSLSSILKFHPYILPQINLSILLG